MKTIPRSKITDEFYAEMLAKETHHNHEIILDDHGTLRWKKNYYVSNIIDEKLDLNQLYILLHHLGYDKNSELMRSLYRCMGYSLYGYWEVFYWETNNQNADKYVPNPAALPDIFKAKI